MSDKDLDEYLNKFLNNSASNISDILKSKSFICSMYLLKYIYDKDKDAYNNFVLMFKNLSDEDKIQVLMNTSVNLKEHEMVKTKKK